MSPTGEKATPHLENIKISGDRKTFYCKNSTKHTHALSLIVTRTHTRINTIHSRDLKVLLFQNPAHIKYGHAASALLTRGKCAVL